MRSKLLMVIAIVAISAGLAGIFLSEQPAQEKQTASQAVSEPAPILYKVYLVRAEHLHRGDALRRADLEVAYLPQSQAQKYGIEGDSLFPLVKFAVYREEMNRGDVILPSDIVAPDAPEFVDLTIKPNHLAYAIAVDPGSIVGGIVHAGSYVDVLALTGVNYREGEFPHHPDRGVSISPVLSHIHVLKVEPGVTSIGSREKGPAHLILEVTRKQVAQLTVAKQIASLEVYQSASSGSAKELQANAGDVLPDFKAVRELRANEVSVK